MKLHNTIIYLIGIPAVGKYTVAKEIGRMTGALAKQRKAGFFPVWLTCEAEKIRQRKNTPERRARLKDNDLTTISWWLQEFEVLKVQHPNALTLDTSHREPQQTAQCILEHMQGADQGDRLATLDMAMDGA